LIEKTKENIGTLPIQIIGLISIDIVDSLLVCRKIGDSFVSIVNLNNYEIADNICLNGRGPKEYLFYVDYGQFAHIGRNIFLHTFDLQSEKHFLLDITTSLKENKTIIANENDMGDYRKFCAGLFFLGDDHFFFKKNVSYEDVRDNTFMPAEYAVFNASNEKRLIPFFGKNLITNPEIPQWTLILYDGSLKIKPDYSRVVDAMFYVDYITYIDLDKLTAKGYKYSESTLSYEDYHTKSRDFILDKHRYGYTNLSVTDEYVFALYSGTPEKVDENEEKYFPYVRIFDWTGIPLASLKLDNMIMSIAFDEKKSLLYGVDISQEKIFVYDLSSELAEIENKMQH
jgi:hypothetical protein